MISNRNLMIGGIALSVLLIISGLVLYTNHEIKLAQQDYSSKILDLNQKTAKNLEKLQSVLENKIGELGFNLSYQIGNVDTSLQNFRKQNQQQITTLNDLIDQIEKQSNIQLNQLKSDLKNIQVQSSDFSAVVNDVLQSVVSIQTNLGQGSGAIIDSKGYVVTNVHVINGASSISALTYSGKTYGAKLVGYDANMDIAVLKISPTDLKALAYGDSDSVKVGQKAIAAGNPAGLSFTITEGIISALRNENGIDYIQTDVPINPGNSGGPLINAQGQIIGINNFKFSGFESLGFAIASNDVRATTDDIIKQYEAKLKQ